MRNPNVFTIEFEYDACDPDGYRAGVIRLSKLAGAAENAVKAFELPAGQSVCPYHYEYAEEWLFVFEGEVVIRDPSGERPAVRGDVICFPSGPEGAHKVTNRGDAAARLLMWSSARAPAVAVYPDSDKVGVWPGKGADHVMLRRADGHVHYYDGEA